MSEVGPNSLTSNARYISVQEPYPLDTMTPLPPSRYQTLSGLFRVLRQRWKLLVITTAIVFALGTGVLFLLQSYSATTIIEVNKDDPSDNDAAQVNGPALTADDIKNEVQTDVSILQTNDALALSVIKQLNLMNESPFSKAVDPEEKDKPLDQAPKTRDKVLKIFSSRLKIDSPPDTRLISITFKSANPFQAAKVTNTLARTFIDDTLDRRQRSILQSSSWLNHELENLKKQMEDSEQRLADYEKNTGLAGIQLTGGANGNGGTSVSVTPQNTVTTRLFALNEELTAAEANRISTEAVDELVKSHDPEVVLGLGPMSVTNGNGGASAITPEGIQAVSALRAQEADLERQLSAVVGKYGENNPRRVQLQQQIDAVKQQLQAELERIRLRAANGYLYAKRNEDSIRAQFQKQEGAANQMADKTVKLQLLAQEAFSNRALYDGLFAKLQTATLASGTRATRIGIVSEAIPAGSTSTKWPLFLAAVAALALFFGVTAAFLRESLDETVRTPQDLDEIQGLTMLGYMPRLQTLLGSDSGAGGSELIASPSSPFSEAFRALRTAINLAIPPTKSRVLLVTSALGGAGKTTVTYNLGVAFAQQGSRVLLIDGDLRNPDLHRLFDTPRIPGLSDAFSKAQQAEVPGVVQHASLPTLFMLPAGELPEFPSELFGSSLFDAILKKLSAQYDYVLIDSPPILAVTDASILATKVNGLIAVVRSRNTTRAALSALTQALHRTHAPVLGFVLNDVQHPTLDGFYEYSYSRSKGGHIAANV